LTPAGAAGSFRLIEADLDLRGGYRLGSASGLVDGLPRLGELFGGLRGQLHIVTRTK
jgi:hypothetical protein